MIERIKMYQLLRKLDNVWFDLFLKELKIDHQEYEIAVQQTIARYDQDSYMKNSND